jgi:hypothetical protein
LDETLEKDLSSQWPPKTSRSSKLISDKVDSKQDKEGHPILIKGEIDQKEITIISLYAPNVNAPNFTKHTLKD